MTGKGRVSTDQYARRVNAAAGLVARGMSPVKAALHLARRYAVSERQARRYVDKAREGAVEVPPRKTVLTVKVPIDLVGRLRSLARRSGQSIGAVVAQALREFLERRGGGVRGGRPSG